METDYISREAAVQLAYGYCHDKDGREGPDDVVDLWHGLQNILAADVRPVARGHWNRYEHDGELFVNYCSACNIYLPPGLDWEPNFCPNCGAMMGGTT